MKKNKLGPRQPLPVALCDVSRKRVYLAAQAKYHEVFKRWSESMKDSGHLATARAPSRLSSMLDDASERYDWYTFTEEGWQWPTPTNPTTP